MGWSTGTELAAYRAAVTSFLDLDPVGVTGQATLLAALATGVAWSEDPAVFGVHLDPHGRVDALLQTPPHSAHLDGPADPVGLVAALAGHELPGVNAPEPVAHAFASAWAQARGTTVREHHRLHLLALPGPAQLVAPPVATTVITRVALPEDLPRVRELHAAMRAEIGETGPTPAQILADRVTAGLLHVVEIDGVAVAMANASVAAAGVSRVAGVYTVPSHRGRGLAAVATAAVTRAAYAAGATHVCLYTDAANPTSNALYERLGYVRRPEDRLVLEFGTG